MPRQVCNYIITHPSVLPRYGASTGAALWATALMDDVIERLLPVDAARRCSGRLHILLCSRRRGPYFCSEFKDRADVKAALLATAHLPYFSDGRYAYKFRGEDHVDGEWLSSREGVLLCRPSSFSVLIDHNDDGGMPDSRGFYEVADRVTHEARFQRGVAYGRELIDSGRMPRSPSISGKAATHRRHHVVRDAGEDDGDEPANRLESHNRSSRKELGRV